nr:hypothetical protein [Tanacetum cinerariifolium]
MFIPFKIVAILVVVHILITSVKPQVTTLKGTYMLVRETILRETLGCASSKSIPDLREDIKVVTTRSDTTLVGPSVPPPPSSPSSSKEVERDPETTTNHVYILSPESTARVPSPVVHLAPASKPKEIPKRNPHQPPIPYPSRLNKNKFQDKSDIQIHKFLQMFKKLHFNISFAEALAQLPKYAKMLKDLLSNKEKLLELANTLLNENCSTVLLKKLPKKLKDPKKFLIPCDFNELEEGMIVADLANWSVAYPAGIAEDVFMQVGKFTFLADFFVVDYDVDPRSTSKYPHKHEDESINQIDIIDITCEDHYHEVLIVQKSIHPLSCNPTPSSDPVVSSLSSSLTPFKDSDFLLEEINTLLFLDDSIPPEIDDGIFDPEGDILLLEKILNNDSIRDPLPTEHKMMKLKRLNL